MGIPIQGIPPTAQPWARGIDKRLDSLESSLGILSDNVSSTPDIDKTVYFEDSLGQNIALGTSGKVTPTNPIKVHFVSSTGLYEVTVSFAGMVRDGAIMGASFESIDAPYEVIYDIPTYGVVQSAPIGQTQWFPFAASYSTVFSARAGAKDLSLYYYAVCTAGTAAAGFVKRARLSVKAV